MCFIVQLLFIFAAWQEIAKPLMHKMFVFIDQRCPTLLKHALEDWLWSPMPWMVVWYFYLHEKKINCQPLKCFYALHNVMTFLQFRCHCFSPVSGLDQHLPFRLLGKGWILLRLTLCCFCKSFLKDIHFDLHLVPNFILFYCFTEVTLEALLQQPSNRIHICGHWMHLLLP